jgi:hypothetical protein
MGLRPALVCAAAMVALVLTGCSDSGGETTGAAPAATKAGAKAAAADDSVNVDNAPVSAKALCERLKEELPRIKAVGSEVGAQAQLTLSIADLYGDNVDKLDGDVVDAQAEKTCPGTRTQLLKAAGVQSFGNL